MNARAFSLYRLIAALILLCSSVHVPCAAAQGDDATVREAAKHFQRGVSLYGEADYRGALVEFKRAYALVPSTAALYNVGETEYQLHDYASALVTFDRYLAETGPSESHHAEVESNVEVLRARVGRLTVTSVPAGAEISVDDQPVGRTPLERPLLVSIGHRKVTASLSGRPLVTRYVDVAADDNVPVTLQLPASSTSTLAPAPEAPGEPPPAQSSDTAGAKGKSTLRLAGWIATGTLAAGAVTFGLVSLKESSDLQAERDTFPASATRLDHSARVTTTYSVLADSLAVAAIVVGGITLFSTLSSSSSPSARASSGGGASVSVGLASAKFEASF